ncbi:MgtC/SapB family protein [Anaerocolumna aminovalerica]|uniref:Putative Mg2+ transporter-C (MgtC) family protein n=1 Tax=Anaerocolumna aminovalerica TaxID=1527 RepID=A0A1I5I759_9FIRM|nr:MgtC/SapB family protein [Anaerocolumna aminovalerica]MDU6264845.1 MgtC/SapB family protein [Anaerocolumna aminovalerica]SFO56367.1 putative Mg2+ transporter-C (MgtC) family protein [Anaerocolumna aminovalerica]
MNGINFDGIYNMLHEVNIVSISVRILLAMLMGGVLGFERGIKNRPAGFRTYMLVCIGSTLVMITNQYMCQTFTDYNIDPARLGAQVVSGIGFLGAGTIIVTSRNQIKGLTTAAGLWVAACLGLAIGTGFYSGAIIGGIAIVIAMIFLHKVDQKIRTGGKIIDIYIEFDNIGHISSFMNYVKENDLEVQDMLMNKGEIPGMDSIALVISLKSNKKMHHAYVIQLLSHAQGIQYIEEI